MAMNKVVIISNLLAISKMLKTGILVELFEIEHSDNQLKRILKNEK